MTTAPGEGQGQQHEGHVDEGVSVSSGEGGTVHAPSVIGHEEFLAILDDIRDRVARGDSWEGHIEWMIPEDPAALPRDLAVRGAYRVGNLHGQGGMRMIGTMITEGAPARKPSPRCTGWCRQQGSRGHYETPQADLDRMSYLMGDGLHADGVVPRKFFPGVADTLYREGFGYHSIADWAGYSHQEGMLAITGQLAHWAAS
jgi:hypothetical protein